MRKGRTGLSIPLGADRYGGFVSLRVTGHPVCVLTELIVKSKVIFGQQVGVKEC